MAEQNSKNPSLKRITLRAARFPIAMLLIGMFLTALAYIDDVFSLSEWKRAFDITDQIGLIITTLAIVTFVYNFIVLICRHYEKKLWDDKNTIASLIVTIARKGLRIIFLLMIINIIITMIGPTHSYLVLANNIIYIIIILSIGWVALQILYTSETVLYQKTLTLTHDEHIRAKALYTRMHIVRNIATVIIAILCIATILMSYASFRNIGISLLASAGFLTAIIGLAAQRTLTSLFAGIQIAFAQPIKIGDVVVIEKESGIVEEITLSYVILKLGDKRRLVIPINYFIEKPFENWSHEGPSLRSSLVFNIDYMMPLEPLRKELDLILENSHYWDRVAKKLQVSQLNGHAVEIRIQVSADNADNLSDLRAEVREKILAFMRENYPQYFPITRQESRTTPRETETN
jgi:small-conductance mechanosensitive channel